MKTLPAIAACLAALLAGCESTDVGDAVRSALGPREAPRTRVFQADQRAAYGAARSAAESMGYRYVRGGPAEGELDALSAIASGDDPGSSRQISMKVRLSGASEGGTEVKVSFNEILEAASAPQEGMATETPMRDTPLYEDFFRNLQNALQAPAKQP